MIINKEKQLTAIISMYSLTQDDIEWMLSHFKKQNNNQQNQPVIVTKKKSHLKDIVK